MPDKLTDNEIIKAFECCYNDKPCSDCPFYVDCNCTTPKNDTEFLPKKIVEIINRLQAENERLKKETKKCKEHYKMACSERNEFLEQLETAKAEAYKEFVERLKESKPIEHKGTLYYETFTIREVDNLLKELVGEV